MQDEKKEQEVLLKVERLCQYFKMGPANELKAVDDVNFEIHRGEVFGLVGESGCGKTTTGRSIIRLYDITSGNVFFKGRRVCAGIRSYQDACRAAKEKYRKEAAEIKEKRKAGEDGASCKRQLQEAKQELSGFLAGQKEQIRLAKEDQKNCNRIYAMEQVKKVKQLYEPSLRQMRQAFGKADAQSGEALFRLAENTLKELEQGRKDLGLGMAGAPLAGKEPAGGGSGKKDALARAQALREGLEAQYREDLRLAKKDRIMNKMQMIFQDPIASLDPRMTVRDIIAEGLVIRGVRDKKLIDEMVYRMLDLVGLVPEHAGRYPHEFSGGQRQRIGIARAIILNPDFIIADEPISALDVSIQAQVINLLNDLRNRLGLTILFIAHDLSVVKYFSDTIAVMYYGKIVEMASSEELFAHPLHPYTKSLLSSIPLPDPEFEKGRRRITYNPIAEHDYSVDKPSMREIAPGHLIHCNQAEFEKYQAQIKAETEAAQ